jgi:hypothetical protein
MLPRTSRQAIARRNKVQHQEDEGNDATRLQVSHALPLIHHRGALEVAHGARRPVSRVAVRFLVRVAGGVGAREGDGDAAARACEAEVGPDAGTSLAGSFNAAGHVPLGGGRYEKGPGFRPSASSGTALQRQSAGWCNSARTGTYTYCSACVRERRCQLYGLVVAPFCCTCVVFSCC